MPTRVLQLFWVLGLVDLDLMFLPAWYMDISAEIHSDRHLQ